MALRQITDVFKNTHHLPGNRRIFRANQLVLQPQDIPGFQNNAKASQTKLERAFFSSE